MLEQTIQTLHLVIQYINMLSYRLMSTAIGASLFTTAHRVSWRGWMDQGHHSWYPALSF